MAESTDTAALTARARELADEDIWTFDADLLRDLADGWERDAARLAAATEALREIDAAFNKGKPATAWQLARAALAAVRGT